MMYNNKLVMVIKHKGEVLREINKDQVELPFGAEYAVSLKNLNTVRAQVKVSIDGLDATDGVSLVISPGQTLDLERFIKDGNLDKGNRFKFIERNAAVEAGRGIKAEDGLIRVEFQYEKQIPWDFYKRNAYDYCDSGPWGGIRGATFTSNAAQGATASFSADAMTQSLSDEAPRGLYKSTVRSKSLKSTPQANTAGITAPGSVSDQGFRLTSSFAVEDQKHVIVLQLVGRRGAMKVAKPVTVKTVRVCTVCTSRKNKFTAKFCGDCGASLEIVGAEKHVTKRSRRTAIPG